jgi:hypothetical protein
VVSVGIVHYFVVILNLFGGSNNQLTASIHALTRLTYARNKHFPGPTSKVGSADLRGC